MLDIQLKNISIDKLKLPLFENKKIEVSVLRLDKIHPLISGNKWFKLRFYIEEAKSLNKKNIVTYGGAWSNHILATAAICQLNGLTSTGIIRGEQATDLSSILQEVKEMGMKLIFLNRQDYQLKIKPDEIMNDECYLIPEGGYGEPGAAGAATILESSKNNYSHICCAAGTGTMAAGLARLGKHSHKTIAISVLKNNTGLESNIDSLNKHYKSNLSIFNDYHFGGYAKYTIELIDFMNDFFRLTTIPSDFVYTAKLFYAITNLAQTDYFAPGDKLLLVHSGGLKGNNSLKKGTLIF